MCCTPVPGKPPPLAPQSLDKYLRLLGPSLAQVKDLAGIEIPEEGLDDLGALWGTRGQEGQRRGSQGWQAEAGKRVWLWSEGGGRIRLSQGPWEGGMGQRPAMEPGNSCWGWGAHNPTLPPRLPVERGGVHTWLPPLLGFTNTSRGFMRGDGVGLMMKGLQRPSLETESL